MPRLEETAEAKSLRLRQQIKNHQRTVMIHAQRGKPYKTSFSLLTRPEDAMDQLVEMFRVTGESLVGCYYRRDDGVVEVHLAASNLDINVALLAKLYGGDGHGAYGSFLIVPSSPQTVTIASKGIRSTG